MVKRRCPLFLFSKEPLVPLKAFADNCLLAAYVWFALPKLRNNSRFYPGWGFLLMQTSGLDIKLELGCGTSLLATLYSLGNPSMPTCLEFWILWVPHAILFWLLFLFCLPKSFSSPVSYFGCLVLFPAYLLYFSSLNPNKVIFECILQDLSLQYS